MSAKFKVGVLPKLIGVNTNGTILIEVTFQFEFSPFKNKKIIGLASDQICSISISMD